MSKLYAGLCAINDGSMDFKDVLVYYTDIPLPVFVYETIIKKKEGKNMSKIMNQAALDLRNFSPEALKKIDSITNVNLIMLPENPSTEFTEAYAAIKKTNILSETHTPGNACFFNGQANFTQKDIAKNSFIVCNGVAILRDIPAEMNIKIIVNGLLIKSPTAFVETVKINGAFYEIDDNAKLIVSNAELNIDQSFINSLTDKTAIIACGKVTIDEQIIEDMLSSKGIRFYSVGKIVANKELHGYIQVNSNEVGSVITHKEDEKKAIGLKKFIRRWR